MHTSADIIIDVGSNHGDFSLAVARRNTRITILAIDPNEMLCQQLLEKAALEQLNNIEIIPVAINLHEGTHNFNLSEHDDAGVSSLLDFDNEKIKNDAYWKNRGDLYFNRQSTVTVKRLDTILSQREIRRIRFIKIDAQGVDINVLKSLGDLLTITDAGMLELSATSDKKLYKNESYDLQSGLNEITNLGFKIYAIKPNDPASNEFNVYFCRENVDYKALEAELQLAGISLYDGKHFWHFPANKEKNVAGIINEVETKLAEAKAKISELAP